MEGNGKEFQDKYKVFFVIGAPGAGKNTQCDLLVEKYSFIHFSAGDLLRAEAKKPTPEGILIQSIIDQGKIVPVKITCGLIKKAMDEYGKDKIFLIDGYPRNQDNINGWIEVFGYECKILCTLYLTCDQDTCVKRILERGRTSGRTDDKEEIIIKRFQTFFNESMPVVEVLRTMCSVIEIPSNTTPEDVFQKICVELDNILQNIK